MYAPADPQLIGQQLVGLVVVGLVLVALYYRRRWQPDTAAHGTARWMTARERAAKLGRPGLVLGRDPDTDRLLSMPNGVPHWMLTGPTGAGKGASYYVPWALTYPHALLAVDPKGELTRIAIAARRRRGQKVYVLDPFRITGHTNTYNPFDDIPDGVAAISEVRAMAEAMVVRSHLGGVDEHWNDRAGDAITAAGTAVAVRCEGAERSLDSLRNLLACGFDGVTRTLIQKGGLYARMGASLEGMEAKERSGVLSTAHRHTNFLDTPEIASVTATSDFSMRELLDGNTSLFLVLPPDKMDENHSRWLRLILASAIRSAFRHANGHELLLLVDEAGTVLSSPMPAVEQALVMGRGYGLRLFTAWQSTSQVKAAFREKESVLLDNCGGKVFLSTNSVETADYLSQALGAYTHVTSSYSVNAGTNRNTDPHGMQSVGTNTSDSLSVSTHKRNLLDPSEILTLPRLAAVCLIQGLPPLLVKRVEWWKEPFLKRLQKGR